jgi:hypothetical protein
VRISVLDKGHAFKAKAFLAFIRLVSRRPAPDVIKMLKYRPDYLGDPLNEVFQEALRGPSPWSVGDRELMAAFISKKNECEF